MRTRTRVYLFKIYFHKKNQKEEDIRFYYFSTLKVFISL